MIYFIYMHYLCMRCMHECYHEIKEWANCEAVRLRCLGAHIFHITQRSPAARLVIDASNNAVQVCTRAHVKFYGTNVSINLPPTRDPQVQVLKNIIVKLHVQTGNPLRKRSGSSLSLDSQALGFNRPIPFFWWRILLLYRGNPSYPPQSYPPSGIRPY